MATTQEVQWAVFWEPLSCLSHRRNTIVLKHSPGSGCLLMRNTFRIKLTCFFHCNYLFLGALHFLHYFFITELYFCFYFSASWLLTLQFIKDVLFKKKKKCFNPNFTGFWTQMRSYWWYKPYQLCSSLLLREKHWQQSPVESLNIFRLTFASGREESKSSATDFMQMMFDTWLFLEESLLYILLSLKTCRTPAWLSLQQPCWREFQDKRCSWKACFFPILVKSVRYTELECWKNFI